MLVVGVIAIVGLIGLTPMGPLLVGLEIAIGFIFWRKAVVESVRPRVSSGPLAVGYYLFAIGWIVASFGVAGLYPWIEDGEVGAYRVGEVSGFLILFGGAPTAFGVLAVVGVPGAAFLLRRGRLDYGTGALLVALAIVLSAALLWIVPIDGWQGNRWEGLLDAIQAACEYMLPPATLGLVGLVHAVRRQQRRGGAPPTGSVPSALKRLNAQPTALRLWQAAQVGTVVVLAVSLAVSYAERDELLAGSTEMGIPASPHATQVHAFHIAPAEAAAVREVVSEFAGSAGLEVRDFSADEPDADGSLVAIELVSGGTTVLVVIGGGNHGAAPIEVHRVATGADARRFAAELTAALREHWPRAAPA